MTVSPMGRSRRRRPPAARRIARQGSCDTLGKTSPSGDSPHTHTPHTHRHTTSPSSENWRLASRRSLLRMSIIGGCPQRSLQRRRAAAPALQRLPGARTRSRLAHRAPRAAGAAGGAPGSSSCTTCIFFDVTVSFQAMFQAPLQQL